METRESGGRAEACMACTCGGGEWGGGARDGEERGMGRSERGAHADAGMACIYREGGGGGTVEVE
eukprot:scaffold1526_cov88-Isochrysis_galbana.AAC.1